MELGTNGCRVISGWIGISSESAPKFRLWAVIQIDIRPGAVVADHSCHCVLAAAVPQSATARDRTTFCRARDGTFRVNPTPHGRCGPDPRSYVHPRIPPMNICDDSALLCEGPGIAATMSDSCRAAGSADSGFTNCRRACLGRGVRPTPRTHCLRQSSRQRHARCSSTGVCVPRLARVGAGACICFSFKSRALLALRASRYHHQALR